MERLRHSHRVHLHLSMVLINNNTDQALKQRILANNRKRKYREGRSQLEISSTIKKRLLNLKQSPSEDWNSVFERILDNVSVSEEDEQDNCLPSDIEGVLLEGEDVNGIFLITTFYYYYYHLCFIFFLL